MAPAGLLLALAAATPTNAQWLWTNTEFAADHGARATTSHTIPPPRARYPLTTRPSAVGVACSLVPEFRPQTVGWAGHHEWESRIFFARWQPGVKLWLDFGAAALDSFTTNAPVVTNHENRVLELDIDAVKVVRLHFFSEAFDLHRTHGTLFQSPTSNAPPRACAQLSAAASWSLKPSS